MLIVATATAKQDSMNLWNEDAEEEQDNEIYTMRDDGKDDGDRDDKGDKDREVKFRNLWNMGKKAINNKHRVMLKSTNQVGIYYIP